MTPDISCLTEIHAKVVEWSAKDIKGNPNCTDHTVITLLLGDDADGNAKACIHLYLPLGTRL
jgi:hypothetical protein